MKIRPLLLSAAAARLAGAAAPCPDKDALSGHVGPGQVHDWIYVPFEVQPGVTSLHVEYACENKTANLLDIGLFDERGHGVEGGGRNDTAGFRGWSFTILDGFTVTPGWGTTPSYVAGPVAHGTWSLVLGPRRVQEGGVGWTATVSYGCEPVADRFAASVAPTELGLDAARAARKDPRDGEVWLRGDFHVHSVYSDGKYLPEQQVANARAQGLDFFFFTEHNSHSGNDVSGAYAPDDMLVGRGMEVTSRFGHWQALGIERGQTIEWRYGPVGNESDGGGDGGYAAAARRVRQSGGLVSVNHPYMDCVECVWRLDPAFEHQDAIEVWNGYGATDLNEPAVALWQRLLAGGKRVAGIGGSDSHDPPSMVGRPTTYVKARSLGSAAIVEGVKRGRVYIVDSPGLSMELTVRGGTQEEGAVLAQMGDIVSKASSGGGLEARLSTVSMSGLTACWVSDKGYVRNDTISEGEGAANVALALEEPLLFVRVEVRNSTGSIIGLTNPIYFR